MASGPSIVATLGLDTTGLQQGLDKAQSRLGKFSTSVAGVFAGGLSVAAIGGAIRGLLSFGDELKDTSESLDLTTTSWQKLIGAFDDVTPDRLAKSISKLNQSIQSAKDGSAEIVRSFSRMGVSWQDLFSLSPDEILLRMSDATVASNDQVATLADTVAILGRGSRELVPALKQGSDAIRAMGDEAMVVDKQVLETSDKISRFFTRAWIDAKAMGVQVIGGLARDVAGLGNWFASKTDIGAFVADSFNKPKVEGDSIPARQINDDEVAKRLLTPLPLSPDEKAQMAKTAQDAKQIGEQVLKDADALLKYKREIRAEEEKIVKAEREAAAEQAKARTDASRKTAEAKTNALENAREEFINDPSARGRHAADRDARRRERLSKRFDRMRVHEIAEEERRARTGAVRVGAPNLLDRAQKSFEAESLKIQADLLQAMNDVKLKLEGKFKNE